MRKTMLYVLKDGMRMTEYPLDAVDEAVEEALALARRFLEGRKCMFREPGNQSEGKVVEVAEWTADKPHRQVRTLCRLALSYND